MSLPVTQNFLTAQAADVNQPASQVQLILGNYASSPGYGATVASSGDDGSGNYPASGAIDGDRTEINVGAASGADNDVGKSSWRSSGIPDHGDTVTLTVNFNASRTINRIKLYHLNSHGLKTYKLSWWDGITWHDFAATSDIVAAGQVSISTVYQLDVIAFSDITTTQIKLTVTHTQVANEAANVVEIEAYRLVDITSRVTGIQTRKQRDYKLANPMAMAVTITCSNDDRFFSINHVPTSDEVAEGFVNPDLGPEVGVTVAFGFDYHLSTPELVTVFTGSIDRLSITPGKREAVIECRDTMKSLVNKTEYTKLKTSIDIASAIQYMLNRANISTFETSLQPTSIILDYFFADNANTLSVIRDLVQAAGDALFFFNEQGIALLQFFSTTTSQNHLFTSETEFEAGTLTNISTKDGTDSLKTPILFNPNPSAGALAGSMALSADRLVLTGTAVTKNNTTGSYTYGDTGQQLILATFTPTVNCTLTAITFPGFSAALAFGAGTYHGNYQISNHDDSVTLYTSNTADFTTNHTFDPLALTGLALALTGGQLYHLRVIAQTVSGFVPSLTQVDKADGSFLGNGFLVTDPSVLPNRTYYVAYSMTLTVSISGTWQSGVYDSFSLAVGTSPIIGLFGAPSYPGSTSETTYVDGSADGVTFDVTYSVSPHTTGTTLSVANRRYWRIRVALSVTDVGSVPYVTPLYLSFGSFGTWVSTTVNCGVNVVEYDALSATVQLNSGSINFYTRSSNDGVAFDDWVLVNNGGPMNSTPRQYLQVRADVFLSGDGTLTAEVLDITLNWQTGGGAPPFPITSSLTLSFDSVNLGIVQQLADNLSGDSSIINDVTVQAQPFVLGGADADTDWQGTIGTPPVAISGSNSLAVVVKTYTFKPYIAGGMDIARMSGANPAAAVVTFGGGAAGTWSFTSIHPTRPVLQIVVTNPGNITDLRIIGKKYSNASYLEVQVSQDAQSMARYGDRQLNISNNFIVGTGVASTIANYLISAFKDPVALISQLIIRPTFSLEDGDRVTVVDDNLDLSADYAVVGIDHTLNASMKGGQAETSLVLLKIPAGE